MAVMSTITDAVSKHDPSVDGVVSWSPDPASGAINIGILASAADRADAIAASFGPDVTVSVVGRPVLTSRVADSSPWYGGDRMYNSGNGSCSTGFAVKSGSTYYELTAGHCGAIGTAWRVGTSYAAGRVLGSTSKRSDSNNSHDVSAVTASGSAAGRVWSGCLTCSSSLAIKGQFNAIVGDPLCWSGSVSQFVCGTNVSSVDDCTYFPDQGLTHCGLTKAYNSNGTPISQPGDSGGPVIYNLGSGNAYAAGTIVGSYGGPAFGIYDPLKYTLPALGVSLVTG
jgi:streptogrisin D